MAFVDPVPALKEQLARIIVERLDGWSQSYAGAFIRADRIKLIDIRCVDEDGANLPCHYPIQPEYGGGGTALFGNGTFGWRYVRKYFQPPFNAPANSPQNCAKALSGRSAEPRTTIKSRPAWRNG